MATDYLINVKDAETMQMVYEQDVDLGFEWQHLNEPVKSGKEIDRLSSNKSSSFGGSGQFFIDSETGEQVPVHGKRNFLSISRSDSGQQVGSQPFNFDDYLDIIDSAAKEVHGQKNSFSQNNATWLPKNQFSSLLPINLQAFKEPAPALQAPVNDQLSNTRSSYLDVAGYEQSRPTANNSRDEIQAKFYNNQINPSCTSDTQFCQQSPIEAKLYSHPQHYTPSVYHSTSSILSAIGSDDGMSVEPTSTSPVKQEPKFPFRQYNNHFTTSPQRSPPVSMGERNPSMTSHPEPGQSFFDLGPKTDMSADYAQNFAPLNSTVPVFSKGLSTSYSNPHFSAYPPPPLHTSPIYSGVPLDSSDRLLNSSMKNSIAEHYESDSGISMDHSPKGFSYLNSCHREEHNESERSLPSSSQAFGFPLQESKHFRFNNMNAFPSVSGKNNKEMKNMTASQARESRDEKKARELKVPFTMDEIILTPVEDYNEMLARTHLNPAQQALIKDIRRRGKNKVAAQNCRKRKIETITIMEEDVDMLRQRRQELAEEQRKLENRQHNIKHRYNALYQQVFSSLRDASGRPYDSNLFRLEQDDGSMVVVPRNCPSSFQGRSDSMDLSRVKLESRF